MSNVKEYMQNLGQAARAASRRLAAATTGQKNEALEAIALAIVANREAIMQANARDVANAKDKGLDSALVDRLELNDARFDAMIEGIRQVAALADPIGEVDGMRYMPSGIQVGQMRVPLGVVGIIYESRPNVTADATALCLKSGNAAILRGGSEAFHANQALADCIRQGLAHAGLPETAVQVVETTDREAVGALVSMPDYVDVIVPRGGQGLIERVAAEARVPVIKHLHGICHVYLDDKADFDKAVSIADNAKNHRYGTCNTMETLLVAQEVAARLLPRVAAVMEEKNVELRGCSATRAVLKDITAATDEDWDTEYLAPILSIKVVKDMDEAIEFINEHGSHHTDAIVTEDYTKARRFLTEVDSSSVMINASTRFADGFEYGLGAEIGISTDKFHARGPVGLEGLTSKKYVVLGDGHIRS